MSTRHPARAARCWRGQRLRTRNGRARPAGRRRWSLPWTPAIPWRPAPDQCATPPGRYGRQRRRWPSRWTPARTWPPPP